MEKVRAGSEISVGQPQTPLPQAVELALRDVVQSRADVAFAYVPVIAFGDEAPSQVLVLFLRASAKPEVSLNEIAPMVKLAVDDTIKNNRGLAVEPLAILPISLSQPLDGLAQAILITDTMLHVTDVQSWHKAKNPKTRLSRAIDWLMGR